MKVLTKFQLIYIFIFLFLLSFSKQLINNNFDKPISNNLHKNFNIYLDNIKLDYENRSQIRKTSNSICKEVLSGNINRHSLRWIFEKFRISLFDLNKTTFNNIAFNTYLFTLILSIIFFNSFYLINKILSENYRNKESKFIILNFLVFIFFINLYLNNPIGEMRFSVFEFFFVTTSFYFALKKKFLPYILCVILCTLNRESGIICSLFWLTINNLNTNREIFNLKLQIKKLNYKSYLPIILSLTSLIVFNLDLIKCFGKSYFFIPSDVSEITLINNELNIFSISSLNGLFNNYLIIIFVIFFFYNKSIIQKKLIILMSIYFSVFLIFTPIIQYEIRILLVPFLIIYIFDFILRRNSNKHFI